MRIFHQTCDGGKAAVTWRTQFHSQTTTFPICLGNTAFPLQAAGGVWATHACFVVVLAVLRGEKVINRAVPVKTVPALLKRVLPLRFRSWRPLQHPCPSFPVLSPPLPPRWAVKCCPNYINKSIRLCKQEVMKVF